MTFCHLVWNVLLETKSKTVRTLFDMVNVTISLSLKAFSLRRREICRFKFLFDFLSLSLNCTPKIGIFYFFSRWKQNASNSLVHLFFKYQLKVWPQYTHCAFSSNLCRGQITQKAIHQLSDLENKKCSPWKVFWTIYPQTLRLLSRRGPRSPDTRLSQHSISPKMTFCFLSNFCRKKFPHLTFLIFIQLWGLSFGKIMR